MSQWTHVAGHIQLNHLGLSGEDDYYKKHIERVKKAFGHIKRKDSEYGFEWTDSERVPQGSEGCLDYDVRVTGYSCDGSESLNWGYVTIWGDLRDYSDHEEIYEWIKSSCEIDYISVRTCSVLIEIEYQGKWLVYNNSEGEIVMVQIEDLKGD